MKNNIKAVAYVVIALACIVASFAGMAFMYFSKDFLPIYVGNVYLVSNRLVRYMLYILLAVILILSFMLIDYSTDFLIKKFRKFHRKYRRR